MKWSKPCLLYCHLQLELLCPVTALQHGHFYTQPPGRYPPRVPPPWTLHPSLVTQTLLLRPPDRDQISLPQGSRLTLAGFTQVPLLIYSYTTTPVLLSCDYWVSLAPSECQLQRQGLLSFPCFQVPGTVSDVWQMSDISVKNQGSEGTCRYSGLQHSGISCLTIPWWVMKVKEKMFTLLGLP